MVCILTANSAAADQVGALVVSQEGVSMWSRAAMTRRDGSLV